MNKVVFFDFHGTLSFKSYSETLKHVLDVNHPNNTITHQDFGNLLNGIYPWNNPEIPHTNLNDADIWWQVMLNKISNVYNTLGFEKDCEELSQIFKKEYTNPKLYPVYEDVEEGLKLLQQNNWRLIILSNHFPELKSVVQNMSIGKYFDDVISSGAIGYEKPNINIYEIAKKRANNPKTAIMVGDNYNADVLGANKASMSAVLVRNEKFKLLSEYYADDITKAAQLIIKAF